MSFGRLKAGCGQNCPPHNLVQAHVHDVEAEALRR
jgi:hypothetical protein